MYYVKIRKCSVNRSDNYAPIVYKNFESRKDVFAWLLGKGFIKYYQPRSNVIYGHEAMYNPDKMMWAEIFKD